MTVEKLIEQLKRFHPKAEVRLNDRNGYPCLFVNAVKDNDESIWLESEADCDLGEALSAGFQNASEEQTDEVDFYSDLLELGINIETVRRYMGDECANHMEYVCTEHGLI